MIVGRVKSWRGCSWWLRGLWGRWGRWWRWFWGFGPRSDRCLCLLRFLSFRWRVGFLVFRFRTYLDRCSTHRTHRTLRLNCRILRLHVWVTCQLICRSWSSLRIWGRIFTWGLTSQSRWVRLLQSLGRIAWSEIQREWGLPHRLRSLRRSFRRSLGFPRRRN